MKRQPVVIVLGAIIAMTGCSTPSRYTQLMNSNEYKLRYDAETERIQKANLYVYAQCDVQLPGHYGLYMPPEGLQGMVPPIGFWTDAQGIHCGSYGTVLSTSNTDPNKQAQRSHGNGAWIVSGPGAAAEGARINSMPMQTWGAGDFGPLINPGGINH